MKHLNMRKEERRVQFIYLAGLWLFFSIIFIFVCFHSSRREELRGAEIIMEQVEERNAILSERRMNLKHLDTLSLLLTQYQPEQKQSFTESGIHYELSELTRTYEDQQEDPKYAIYMQIQRFYSMFYFDKKATWNTNINSAFMKKNLDACEIGFQQNQQTITLQEALQNNTTPKN